MRVVVARPMQPPARVVRHIEAGSFVSPLEVRQASPPRRNAPWVLVSWMNHMARIDHHLHTNRYSPDSIIDPRELLCRAQEAGLDGVVITEHDCLWPEHELEELAEAGRALGVTVMNGVEISAREGDVLVYGLKSLKDVGRSVDLRRLLDVASEQGAAVVAAHPFRFGQDFWKILQHFGPVFDALELASNNITPDLRGRIQQVLNGSPMGATASSDAHSPEVVGCYYSEFSRAITKLDDFIDALKKREARPRHNPGRRNMSGPFGK